MAQTKSWLSSTTIWGILTAAVPVVAQVYDFVAAIPAEILPPPVSAIISTVGLVVAALGRAKATKPLVASRK